MNSFALWNVIIEQQNSTLVGQEHPEYEDEKDGYQLRIMASIGRRSQTRLPNNKLGSRQKRCLLLIRHIQLRKILRKYPLINHLPDERENQHQAIVVTRIR